MDYSDAYLREFLPKENPPEGSVPAEVEEEIHRWREHAELADRELVARSTRWTYAMFAALGEGQIQRTRAAFAPLGARILARSVSIGLFDPAEKPGFGLVLDMPPWDGPAFDVFDEIRFPRLGLSFPIALRQSETTLHAPPHPANATSACWARCNKNAVWGVLTAGHALSGNRPGRPVRLAGGGTGSLLRSWYQPIDAAFVTTQNPQTMPAALPALGFPAAGQAVRLASQSGPQPRTIVRVMDSMGVLHTREFAVLLFLDQPGKPGDSGALTQMPTGEAVGIYKGAMTSPQTGSSVGLAQNFEQAAYALDITPYL